MLYCAETTTEAQRDFAEPVISRLPDLQQSTSPPPGEVPVIPELKGLGLPGAVS